MEVSEVDGLKTVQKQGGQMGGICYGWGGNMSQWLTKEIEGASLPNLRAKPTFTQTVTKTMDTCLFSILLHR